MIFHLKKQIYVYLFPHFLLFIFYTDLPAQRHPNSSYGAASSGLKPKYHCAYSRLCASGGFGLCYWYLVFMPFVAL